MRSKPKFKKEVRFLILRELTINGKNFTLYLVVRGIKGVEHLGFLHGRKDEVLKILSSSKLMNEVKVVLNVRDLNNEKLSFLNDNELISYLLRLKPFIDSLSDELVKLITSQNV